MNVLRLKKQLDALQKRSGVPKKWARFIWCKEDESYEEAQERYEQEHGSIDLDKYFPVFFVGCKSVNSQSNF